MKKIYIIALIAAMVSGLLLYGFLSGYEKKDTANATDMKTEQGAKVEQVVVAVQDIPAYTEITSEMVNVKTVTSGASHASVAHKTEDVVGKITKGLIVAEEQIITTKLLDNDGEGSSLSLQIPKGMRAMTISTDTISGVAGYIEENDLVDILVNVEASPNDEVKVSGKTKSIKSSVTDTVVQAVKVLKVGEVTTQKDGFVYSNITVLMTPQQCQQVFTAEKRGTIRVTLRQKTDEKKVIMNPIIMGDLFE